MIDPITTSPASVTSSTASAPQNGGIGAPMPVFGTNSNSAGTSTNPAPSKNKLSPKLVVGLLAVVLTLFGGAAGLLLSETGQDIRQQASEPTYNDLCIEQYGGNPMLMAQAVSSCESQSGKFWNAVACECQNEQGGTTEVRWVPVTH